MCSKYKLAALNQFFLRLNELPIRVVHRCQLFMWSTLQTPACYVKFVGDFARAKRTDCKFIILAPYVLPFTALKNGYADELLQE